MTTMIQVLSNGFDSQQRFSIQQRLSLTTAGFQPHPIDSVLFLQPADCSSVAILLLSKSGLVARNRVGRELSQEQ